METRLPSLRAAVALSLMLIAAATATARPLLQQRGSLSAGGTVGIDLPLAQADAEWGPAFGAMGRYGLGSHLALEASFRWSLPRDAETPLGGPIDAPQFRSGLVELRLRSRAFGFAFSGHAGLGLSDLSLPGAFDRGPRPAARLGLSAELPMGPMMWLAGPSVLLVDNGGGTRKNLELRVAALYSFR